MKWTICTKTKFFQNFLEIVTKTDAKSCNFYEHATCVSYIVQSFNPYRTNCLPRCRHESVHQENIDVSLSSKNVFDVRFYKDILKLGCRKVWTISVGKFSNI